MLLFGQSPNAGGRQFCKLFSTEIVEKHKYKHIKHVIVVMELFLHFDYGNATTLQHICVVIVTECY